ncbi:MAG TPA: dTDP-4-dehydrorhamnose 3,5-epimerase [Jatrophihabitans sp.]|nr:dTDP-4-dehydrorhamnose 3,5-epimerase [Jatrophihabitans sp.]
MKVTVTEEDLPGVRTIDPSIFTDDRGFFYENYSSRTLAEHGIDLVFVQDNHSRSRANVIRGLHYQGPAGAQWRLVRCTVGEIFDVIVDLDLGSPTFGQWRGYRLSAENKRQLLIPPAYAHGFAVLSEVAEVQYKCSNWHNAQAERALAFDDPYLGIEWPLAGPPVTSAKDAAAPSFKDYQANPDFPAGWADSLEENR